MATLPADVVATSRHRLTVADFHRMGETGILRPDDRVELIHGEIIDMSPIGSLHAALVARISMTFSQHVGDRAVVWTQNPVAIDDVSQPQPDVAVLRPRPDCYAAAHPRPADVLLVVEVADTTLAFDLAVKVPLYAAAGIPETWVIDAATLRTHRFRQPAGGRFTAEETIAADAPLACGVDMAAGEALAGLCLTMRSLLPRP
ncbi:MAG: Uma2 family endonuclease [Planctomycetia bacterium]